MSNVKMPGIGSQVRKAEDDTEKAAKCKILFEMDYIDAYNAVLMQRKGIFNSCGRESGSLECALLR
jgi:hypothetical protein